MNNNCEVTSNYRYLLTETYDTDVKTKTKRAYDGAIGDDDFNYKENNIFLLEEIEETMRDCGYTSNKDFSDNISVICDEYAMNDTLCYEMVEQLTKEGYMDRMTRTNVEGKEKTFIEILRLTLYVYINDLCDNNKNRLLYNSRI